MFAALKRSSLSVSKQLGLTGWVANSTWRRSRLLIVCYHGVSVADEHQWNPFLYVSPETLARRFELLDRTGCSVLPLQQAVQRLYAGTLPDRAVALTFDDGFHDFKIKALPLLDRHGYASTVYVPTQRCEHRTPSMQLIASYIFWRHQHATLDARGMEGLDAVFPLHTAAERQRLVAHLLSVARRNAMYPADKDALLSRVFARLGVDYAAVVQTRILALMAPSDVAEMARRGVAIELHTHRHRAPADLQKFVAEVRLNRERLTAITGRVPSHFCYPSGVYRPGYVEALEREGIATATTCDPELASRESHRLLLPRFIDTEAVTDNEFEAWITGAASWLPRRTRRAHAVH